MKKLLFFALFFLSSCVQPKDRDLILINANVITLNPQNPLAEIVVIKNDKILFVGNKTDLEKYNSQSTKVIDLQGKTIIPGFIDAHAHFLSLGNALKNINLNNINYWSEAEELVKETVKNSQPGDWITGRGWHQEKWQKIPEQAVNGYPIHNSISAISPNNPIILKHASGHALFANAKALEIANITSKTKNPDGGEIIKDKQGNPTGILLETAMDLVTDIHKKYLESLSAEKQRQINLEYIEEAMAHCLEKGITTFHDAGSFFNEIDLFKNLAVQGKLDMRLWVMISSEEPLSTALL